jgi:hypothetical protein
MAKRRSTSNSIKIFRSLLVLSLLEVRTGARRKVLVFWRFALGIDAHLLSRAGHPLVPVHLLQRI